MSRIISRLKYYFAIILTAVRARPPVGGMEISDATVRLVFFDGAAWRFGGVRLEPGVLEGGKIKDHARFVDALQSVKAQVFGTTHRDRRVMIVASLSSASIYSQVFNLPSLARENLAKAVELNLQMVSPIDAAQSYSGWQVVGEDRHASKIEVLGAFIDRSLADAIAGACLDGGFSLVVLESRALSLARLIRERGIGVDPSKAYIVAHLNDAGLDFLVLRHGQAYFEYFNPWREIVNDQGEISAELFQSTITRNLYQVLNFYSQHWPDPVSEILIAAPAIATDLATVIQEHFPIAPRNLDLRTETPAGAEWFTSIGSYLRAAQPRQNDVEIDLLGIGAQDSFRRDQFVEFAKFWSIFLPIALGLITLIFFTADIFLAHIGSAGFESFSNLTGAQINEGQRLQAEAQDFNRRVAFIRNAESTSFPKSSVLDELRATLIANTITPIRIVIHGHDDPISLSGLAKSEEALSTFKNALQSTASFKNINLPLSGIASGPNGVTFLMTLQLP